MPSRGLGAKMVLVSGLFAVCLTAVAAVGETVYGIGDRSSSDSQFEPITPLADPPPLDPAKVALGERLFSDPILSSKNELACSSCHDLNAGGTVSLKRTIGYNGKMHRFNAPTIFNVANNYRLGWRGNFTSLEEQNEAVLLDPNLMASEWKTLLPKLRDSKSYGPEFQRVYGREIDRQSLLDALTTFQRSLVTPNARFDQFLRGDRNAITADEARGYALFKSYGCISCHQGSNVGGNIFQKFGIFAEAMPVNSDAGNDGNLGRWTITGRDTDRGVFRVPSLRNVEVTAPYFHDGRVGTLPEAVKIMARSQLGLTVDDRDVASIVAFLKTLTGEYKGRPLNVTVPPGGK
ncbi:cytochrome c peroxidase [Rhizobium sp. BK251]|uniref:cytochrome-c peroxidase n=1 Tax=Rhizobium sp. BK251 TaxID=2512125 RepID=UPI00104DC524|nr:cytochrome c peroxidase [Rhizobium sp. BK251]TCL74842.1 cytochrome c peroxidase [Rhizobium sp. BK251]